MPGKSGARSSAKKSQQSGDRSQNSKRQSSSRADDRGISPRPDQAGCRVAARTPGQRVRCPNPRLRYVVRHDLMRYRARHPHGAATTRSRKPCHDAPARSFCRQGWAAPACIRAVTPQRAEPNSRAPITGASGKSSPNATTRTGQTYDELGHYERRRYVAAVSGKPATSK